MPDERFVFFDFDDTISDPFVFHAQYVREIGAILAPKFGGDIEQWAKVAIDTLEALEEEYQERFQDNPLAGYCAWLETVRERSARQMFERMGLPVPSDVVRIARETQFNALIGCNAAFPGAIDCFAALFQRGYRVQMASGQESEFLMAALMGAGLESYTESKFGPDLIDCAKEGREYYSRIFEATGVNPRHAVVVDDWPPAIKWAMKTGATVIQSKLSQERHFQTVEGVAAELMDLYALPELIDQIFNRITL